jgi:CRISPR-associated protein Cmr4
VGASAGEETGNLNLIFRDQFTQTGIIPGSSIRGRFRADMRLNRLGLQETSQTSSANIDENFWYGHEAVENQKDSGTTEALVKFEYASLVWLPVFCPGQPIVWVTCPRLLKRYQRITGKPKNGETQLAPIPQPSGKGNNKQHPVKLREHRERLFFNLGFLDNLIKTEELSNWVPQGTQCQPDNLVVVEDADISIIHDMALYRQTRTKLENEVKKVDKFFGFEAIPEGSIFVFPIAIKESIPQREKDALTKLKQEEKWQPFNTDNSEELYFGGLESIGCGRCHVILAGEYFNDNQTGGN